MKITHLNDDEIQRFIFDFSACETEIIKHIYSCEKCKMGADNYLSLSNAIKSQPKPVLNFNLQEQVLEQLITPSKVISTFNYTIYFLILTSVGVVTAALYLFKDSIIGLFNFTTTSSFMVSIVMMITFALALDLVKSFNKKVSILNYY